MEVLETEQIPAVVVAKVVVPETEIQMLWNAYKKEGSASAKRDLMMSYMWLVKYVLHTMSLPTSSILDEEDFVHIGILGLSEAIDRYEADRGIKFETFAIPRVKGIVLDELRRLDWLTRTARKRVHDFMNAADKLRSEQGREVSPEEIRQKLNVTPQEYQQYLNAAAAAVATLSMNEAKQSSFGDEDDGDVMNEVPDPDFAHPLQRMVDEERMSVITTFLNSLPERKRLVMTLYYYENLTFKEIGQVLDVTESRICQIHGQVCNELKTKLVAFDNS